MRIDDQGLEDSLLRFSVASVFMSTIANGARGKLCQRLVGQKFNSLQGVRVLSYREGRPSSWSLKEQQLAHNQTEETFQQNPFSLRILCASIDARSSSSEVRSPSLASG